MSSPASSSTPKVTSGQTVSAWGFTFLTPDTLSDRATMTESARWNYTLHNALEKAYLGFFGGAAASFLVTRSVAGRIGVTAAATGFGLGKAYIDARYVFGHDVVADKTWVASVGVTKQ